MPTDATKTGLQIKLAESAVFLQTTGSTGSRDVSQTQPTVLRGLLQFDVGKPIKVKEIKVELQAKSIVGWVEGIGTHRTDNSESHKVFSATHTVFSAPGSSSTAPIAEDDDVESIYPDSVFTGIGVGPGAARNSVYSVMSGDSDRGGPSSRDARRSSRQSASSSILPPTPSTSTSFASSSHTPSLTPSSYTTMSSLASSPSTPSDFNGLAGVRPLHLHGYEDSSSTTSSRRVSFDEPPMPKPSFYSSNRRPYHRRSTSNSVSIDPNLEGVPEVTTTPHASPHSSPNPNTTPLEPPPYSYDPQQAPNNSEALSEQTEGARLAPVRPHSVSWDDTHSQHGNNPAFGSPSGQAEESRGREKKKKRFSFSAIFNAIRGKSKSRSKSKSRVSVIPQEQHKDASDTSTQREGSHAGSDRRREVGTMSVRSGVSGDSGDTVTANGLRGGRKTETGSNTPSQSGRSRLSFGMISDILGADADVDKEKDAVVEGDGWREFKRGTYTYPISFVVPGHAPPTLDCPNGNVAWKIKGTVVRAGTFSSNIITTHPVLVIATPCPSLSSPSADEELIVVERSWEDQLHYLLSISGRSFHIGGRIPISFCLVPLREVKIHRVSVVLEEKIEYWTNFKRVARADPVVPYQLITVRQTPQEAGSDTPDHVLPLHSSSLQVLQDSPLASVLDKRELNEDNAVAFAGAGPWRWDTEVDLPGTCRSLHSSCKNRRSNMRVDHILKCVLRVERGGDADSPPPQEGEDRPKKKRKLFDIVIQTPVVILNCRCSPEWTALPYYDTVFSEPGISHPCPCVERRLAEVEKRTATVPKNRMSNDYSKRSSLATGERTTSEKRTSAISAISASSFKRLSSVSSSHSAEITRDTALQETMAALLRNETSNSATDTLALRNLQFERLISGTENAAGERVPVYVG